MGFSFDHSGKEDWQFFSADSNYGAADMEFKVLNML